MILLTNIFTSYFYIGKDAWPELVGEKGKKAEKIIEHENPHVDAIIVPEGSFVTQDFRCDRVWVWVDCDDKVIRTPMIG